MKIPTSLKHKPVIVVENYKNVDGKYIDDPNSNAEGLSLGLAQWMDRGKIDISAKVWRYTNHKWSRQSEEIPLHRVLDMAILICSAYEFVKEKSYRYPEKYDPNHPVIDRIGLNGDAMNIEVCTDNPEISGDLTLFADALNSDGENLGERLAVLARLLKDMGY